MKSIYLHRRPIKMQLYARPIHLIPQQQCIEYDRLESATWINMIAAVNAHIACRYFSVSLHSFPSLPSSILPSHTHTPFRVLSGTYDGVQANQRCPHFWKCRRNQPPSHQIGEGRKAHLSLANKSACLFTLSRACCCLLCVKSVLLLTLLRVCCCLLCVKSVLLFTFTALSDVEGCYTKQSQTNERYHN